MELLRIFGDQFINDFIINFGVLFSSYLHGCKGNYGARIESYNDCE